MRISPVLKVLMLAPLVPAAGYVFLSLTLFSADTEGFFAWRMSPVSATLIGAAYGGSCVMLAMALRARQWEKVRVAVAATSLLMPLMLGACLLGRGTLQLRAGSLFAVPGAWIWLAIHAAAPLIGLVALGAQALVKGERPRRAVGLPWWVAAPVVGNGLAVTAAGLLLYAVPGPAARHWPWEVSELDVRVIGAWCLTFGAALLISSREAELRRVRNGMAALIVTGVFGLIGLIRYADEVNWGSPGSWLVVLVLLSFTGLGLSGIGISWMLDPPEEPVAAIPSAAVDAQS